MSPDDLPETIPSLLAMRATETPEGVACCQWEGRAWRSISWSDLTRHVWRAASALQSQGLRSGDLLGICARTRLHWYVGELAALSVGACVVGIDSHESALRKSRVLAHPGLKGLLVDNPNVLTGVPADAVGRMRFVVSLDAAPTAGQSNRRHNAVPEFAPISWQEMMSDSAAFQTHPPVPVEADMAAGMFLTSGSTGEPKAIRYSHRQMMIACRSVFDLFPGMLPRDRTICWLPMSNLFQRMLNLVAMAVGGSVYFVEDPKSIGTMIREVEPTILVGVPRFYEKLHRQIVQQVDTAGGIKGFIAGEAIRRLSASSRSAPGSQRFPGVRALKRATTDRWVLAQLRQKVFGSRIQFLMSGSAPLPRNVLEFFEAMGVPILEAYGLTENSVPVAMNSPQARRPGSVGKPLPANRIRIADDGEICISGPGVFRAYEGETPDGDRFTDDEFYRTGDIGYLDSDGFLYLTGRKSSMIKTSTGRRITPEHAEAVYRQSPLIEQVVVVGNNRPFLAGLVVASRRDISEEQISGELRRLEGQLPVHERIQRFSLLSEPLQIETGELTSTLKPRRQVIEARYASLIERLYAEDWPVAVGRPAHANSIQEVGR